MRSPRARVWLGLWIAVIVACVVPWIGWQDHSHWSGRAGFVMLWAIALSISTEASQIYSHGRFPSATDVLTNVIGAGLGVVLAKARFWPRVREIKTPGTAG